jgi:hypothetical protein
MMMRRIVIAIVALVALSSAALGQCNGQFAPGHLCGFTGLSLGLPGSVSQGAMLDSGLGATRGSVAVRGAFGWTILPPGANGFPLTSNGAGADPSYQPTGATATLIAPPGRLTLTSGVPIMTASVVGVTSLYYTLGPVGSSFPIYNGSNYVATAYTQLTNVSTDQTVNPSQVAPSSVYDIYGWSNGGIVTLSRSPAWFSNTSRCSGGEPCTGATEPTDPQLVGGFYLNRNAITGTCSSACPGANRGTYLGTVYSDASGTYTVNFGGGAAGGSPGFLGVYNFYNQVQNTAFVYDTTASYTYSSTTARQWNGSAGNQVTFVKGFNDNAVTVSAQQLLAIGAIAGANATSGWALDITNGFSQASFCSAPGTTTYFCSPPVVSTFRFASHGGPPTLTTFGAHVVAGVEKGDGTNAYTYEGNNSAEQYLQVGVWQ